MRAFLSTVLLSLLLFSVPFGLIMAIYYLHIWAWIIFGLLVGTSLVVGAESKQQR